jgi:hypothetical protein
MIHTLSIFLCELLFRRSFNQLKEVKSVTVKRNWFRRELGESRRVLFLRYDSQKN